MGKILTENTGKINRKFAGFTQETGDFFWDLVFNNERSWFQEHRERFEAVLNEPFKALAYETTVLVQKDFPAEMLECHAARIYRDARRLYGRGPYKDNLWFSIKNRTGETDGPSFFFEITPKSWCYGMGFYCPKAEQMENFRKSIDANPERFLRLARAVERMPEFELEGETYKRPKGYPEEPIGRWYNRKWISIVSNHDFGGELFSENLPVILASEFAKLMPMYGYLNKYCR